MMILKNKNGCGKIAVWSALVLVLTACGGGSQPSSDSSAGGAPSSPPAGNNSNDRTAPNVALSAPASGATVTGTINVTATASDPTVAGQTASGMAGVQFKLNGSNLGAEDRNAPYSVSWSTGAVANGSYTLTAVARDVAGNTRTSAAMTVTVSNAVPPPPSGSALTMPSLADERSTYTKWGWTWTASQEPGAVTEPIANYFVSNIDIHGDLEGDDLWTYLMMYRRTGNAVYLNRAQAWLRYYKDEYRNSSDFAYDEGFLHDHMFGWGLVAWYEHSCLTSTCDMAALAEAENLAAVVESYWSTRVNNNWPTPGQFTMAYYSLRQGARHLLLATRVAEATGKARWITLRDRLLALWLQSPDWDARGMYFHGDYETDRILSENGVNSTHAAGARVVSSFQIGVLAEAFWHAYRTISDSATRTALRGRLIPMAQFIDQYGLDPSCQYTASAYGFVNGQLWHKYSCGGFWDPVYTTAMVNTLVMGYKLTNDTHFYDRAKHFFNRGTKGIYGSSTARQAPDNRVGHFIDTTFATSTANRYLEYNKGELQYTYLIFENGGL